MSGPDQLPNEPTSMTSAPSAVRDRRVPPTGVLPRRVQTWLMAGLAAVIVVIILITGRPQPPARATLGSRVADAVLAPADRIRTYAQQLAAEDAQARSDPKTASRGATAGASAPRANDGRASGVSSLLADNVVQSHRPEGQQPFATTSARAAASIPPAPGPTDPTLAALEQTVARLTPGLAARGLSAPPVTPVAVAAPMPIASSVAMGTASAPKATTEFPAEGPRLRLFEGTVIETVLLTRLNGTMASPVTCLVTTPVYSTDRQHVVIPAGARVLGAAAAVQSWGDSRLAVSFHRLLMPDGHTYSLDLFKGLDAVGETGLTESVNHHYLQVFGASVAIGALAGLAQYDTHVGLDAASFSDEYRQAAGSSLAGSASRVLDRYLNVLPTITIHEGYRVHVYLTNDLELPAYAVEEGAQP